MRLFTTVWGRRVVLVLLLGVSVYFANAKYHKLFKENTALYKERATMISYISLLEEHNKRTINELKACRSDISKAGLEIMGASIHPRIVLLASSTKGKVNVTKKTCRAVQARINQIISRIETSEVFTPAQKRYLMTIVDFERIFHSSVCKKALGKL